MNVTTRQLEAFLAVARLGSFTRAAEEIHMTQAGLSLLLKTFEEQVGARLFDRTTRTVRITTAGESLLPAVRLMLAEWERATAEVGRLTAAAERQLTLAATPLIASSVLPGWLGEFHRAHPGVRVLIRDVDRQGIQRGVESGEFDLGLGAFFKPVVGLERSALASFRMVRVAPRAGAGRTRRESARWSDFTGERLLCLEPDNPIQKLVDAQLRGQAVSVTRVGPLQNLQAIIAMVEAGQGVAALPGFVIPACVRFDVSARRLVEPEVPIDFFAVTRKGRIPTSLADHLIASIQRRFVEIARMANRPASARGPSA